MDRSTRTVWVALLGNVAIAATKFAVAAITQSSAMWSEGIHSSVDTWNQLLMLIGLRRSRRRSDVAHPFGHGKELYFWNLLVAVLILGVGGGISAYQGIIHILHRVAIREPQWNYAVLGCAFLFEGISFTIALRAFRVQHGRRNIIATIIASKDPTTYTILAEDAAALAGLIVAALGIGLSQWLHMPALDGVASVLIGALLAVVATFLIHECRGLLVGEGVDGRSEREIRRITSENPLVESVSRPLTMYIGPANILVTLDVHFDATASVSDVAGAIDQIKIRLRQRFPHMKRIYIEAISSPGPKMSKQVKQNSR